MLNFLKSVKTQLFLALTSMLIMSTASHADTDNGGTTLTVPTFITGDEVSGQIGWFELLGNTVLHYINEYIMPLMLVGFGIGWLFFFLFMGNRKAKGSVAS